jgi:hypothetical protein
LIFILLHPHSCKTNQGPFGGPDAIFINQLKPLLNYSTILISQQAMKRRIHSTPLRFYHPY